MPRLQVQLPLCLDVWQAFTLGSIWNRHCVTPQMTWMCSSCSGTETSHWSYIWGFIYLLQRGYRGYWPFFCDNWGKRFCLWWLNSPLPNRQKVESLKSNFSYKQIYKTGDRFKCRVCTETDKSRGCCCGNQHLTCCALEKLQNLSFCHGEK